MNLRSNFFMVGALLLLHMVLALAYAADTPYRTPGIIFHQPAPDIGAPDELQHVNYVQQLIDGKGFPVLDKSDPKLGEHYQSHQPPLFYMLEAAWANVTRQSDLTTKTSGLLLRSFNAIIGCTNVLAVFYLAWWGFGRRDLALCATAFAALLPMNIALSGAVSNDPLLFALCTWSLAVSALALNDGWTLKRGVALGILVGLALLTKTTAVALVPAILAAAYLSGAPKPKIQIVATAAGVALLLALPWWVRNQSLYGDPLAMKAFNEAFTGNPTRTTLGLGWLDYAVNWVGWWTARSFVGMFGYMHIQLPDTFYRIALAVLLILALGAFLAIGTPEWKKHKPMHILNGTFICFVVLSFAAFNVKYFQGQARYLFPALGPVSVGFALGLLYFGKEKWKSSFIAYVLVLTAINLYIVGQWLPNEFARRMGSTAQVGSSS